VTQGIAVGMLQGVSSVHSAISSIGNTISRGNYGNLTGGSSFGLTALPAGSGAQSQPINVTIQMTTSDVQKWLQTGTLRYNLRNPSNGLSLFGRGSS
jgi:hypothetical protein